jgi:hypothetical protein
MRIGLNALLLSNEDGYRRTGVSRYIDELVRHLPGALDPDDRLTLFASATSTVPDDPSITVRRAPRWAAGPTARIAWEQAALPVAARRGALDLFHGTVNVLPRGAQHAQRRHDPRPRLPRVAGPPAVGPAALPRVGCPGRPSAVPASS